MLNLNKRTTKRNLDGHSCICVSLCTTVVYNTTQNGSRNFPCLILQTIITVQTMSTGGEGDQHCKIMRVWQRIKGWDGVMASLVIGG